MDQAIKTIEYYRRLPYTLRAEPARDSDGNDYWTAEYLELRGCKTDATTEAEAIANQQELFDDYISARLETKTEIPEPAPLSGAVEDLWIFVPREWISAQKPPPDVEDTKHTDATAREIAA